MQAKARLPLQASATRSASKMDPRPQGCAWSSLPPKVGGLALHTRAGCAVRVVYTPSATNGGAAVPITGGGPRPAVILEVPLCNPLEPTVTAERPATTFLEAKAHKGGWE